MTDITTDPPEIDPNPNHNTDPQPQNQQPAHQPTQQDKQEIEPQNHHKKRKRKHHRKQRTVRDPEEIKSIRLQRINIKREVHWDSRFVNDTIPDLFKPKKRRIEHASRSRPLQSAYVEKQRPKLPELQKERLHDTAPRNNHRAFKIRHLKKETQAAVKQEEVKKDEAEGEVEKINKKINRREKNKERLLLKLEEKTKIFPINNQYRSLLVDLIEKAAEKKHKSIRTNIQKQIDSIGGDNTYSRLQKMVDERKFMLKQIAISGGSTILKTYLDLQLHSLALIEQILKFKAHWQAIYHDSLHSPTRVNFYYHDTPYLLEMNKEVSEIAKNDPFLLAPTAALQSLSNLQPKEQQLSQRKEMLLKIRACELLLIEEELLASL